VAVTDLQALAEALDRHATATAAHATAIRNNLADRKDPA
jgi:hypothetical protein